MRQQDIIAEFKSRLRKLLARENKKFVIDHVYALNEYRMISDDDLAQAIYEACVNDSFDFERTRFEKFVLAVIHDS